MDECKPLPRALVVGVHVAAVGGHLVGAVLAGGAYLRAGTEEQRSPSHRMSRNERAKKKTQNMSQNVKKRKKKSPKTLKL